MITGILWAFLASTCPIAPAIAQSEGPAAWRSLPLIKSGAVDPAWTQIGYGGWSVVDGTLRTDSDERGLGVLVYTKETFGDCRLRVVYRSNDAKSNSGVYVRLDDGILAQAGKNHPPGKRGPDGKLTPESLQHFKDGAAQELGAWYAVSHGYEVQICDTGDRFHRTGAIYSLAPSAALPEKKPDEWKTMIITLEGNKVLVEIDGRQISTFDPTSPDVPPQKNWTEPRRETPRPTAGYIGLQTHDPGDVVYFREISVSPL
jgi:hypothetical protein